MCKISFCKLSFRTKTDWRENWNKAQKETDSIGKTALLLAIENEKKNQKAISTNLNFDPDKIRMLIT